MCKINNHSTSKSIHDQDILLYGEQENLNHLTNENNMKKTKSFFQLKLKSVDEDDEEVIANRVQRLKQCFEECQCLDKISERLMLSDNEKQMLQKLYRMHDMNKTEVTSYLMKIKKRKDPNELKIIKAFFEMFCLKGLDLVSTLEMIAKHMDLNTGVETSDMDYFLNHLAQQYYNQNISKYNSPEDIHTMFNSLMLKNLMWNMISKEGKEDEMLNNGPKVFANDVVHRLKDVRYMEEMIKCYKKIYENPILIQNFEIETVNDVSSYLFSSTTFPKDSNKQFIEYMAKIQPKVIFMSRVKVKIFNFKNWDTVSNIISKTKIQTKDKTKIKDALMLITSKAIWVDQQPIRAKDITKLSSASSLEVNMELNLYNLISNFENCYAIPLTNGFSYCSDGSNRFCFMQATQSIRVWRFDFKVKPHIKLDNLCNQINYMAAMCTRPIEKSLRKNIEKQINLNTESKDKEFDIKLFIQSIYVHHDLADVCCYNCAHERAYKIDVFSMIGDFFKQMVIQCEKELSQAKDVRNLKHIKTVQQLGKFLSKRYSIYTKALSDISISSNLIL